MTASPVVRIRLLAATTVALAALALTACQNGEGVRDEGPSTAASSASPRHAAAPATAPCSGSRTRTTATAVSRPANRLLLRLTNTGTANCTLTGYPRARFGEEPSAVQPAEETRPRTALTLSPGESAYAGVVLSSADGSAAHARTARTLTLTLPAGPAAHPPLPARGVHVDDAMTVTYWLSSGEAALMY
ncbi:DUF4232 domain-containing protein [Streptomyces sp. NPDC001222]|uniref:DUF4232 domain-containing protein n=1 Tax=Streptomyces sp. NPDC001222 TaxID=3364548 RepID=UPI00369539A1